MSKLPNKVQGKHLVKDKDDDSPADKDFWKQQTDMDRFASETRTRKMIQEVCLPMLENQQTLQNKLDKEVDKKLEELSERLGKAEYGLYRSDKPDTRFDKIYKRLEEVELAHRKDSAFVKEQDKVLNARLADEIFKFN